MYMYIYIYICIYSTYTYKCYCGIFWIFLDDSHVVESKSQHSPGSVCPLPKSLRHFSSALQPSTNPWACGCIAMCGATFVRGCHFTDLCWARIRRSIVWSQCGSILSFCNESTLSQSPAPMPIVLTMTIYMGDPLKKHGILHAPGFKTNACYEAKVCSVSDLTALWVRLTRALPHHNLFFPVT